jgi:acyl-[acyl-carrier-protein] desaturase
MADLTYRGEPELEAAFWRLYRDFFDRAERRRRWSVRDDIPWERCNHELNPAVADVVESFCAVELYLPDYTSKILPVVRHSKGRTWFYANWGYEEMKHSLALSDWLLRSGQRTEEQMADLEADVFRREWNLPHDSHLGMLAYAMVQELATGLNYRNLRRRLVELGGDPALAKLLTLVSVDEQAHYSFFRECVSLFLKYDRPAMLEQLRRVMNNFAMPAIHEFADGRQRVARIKKLAIFDEDIYYREVYLPILASLGVSRAEMRDRAPRRKSAPEITGDAA